MHNEFIKAMVAISAEMVNPLKNKAGAGRFPYVELDTLLDIIRPIAAKHGVAVLQYVTESGDQLITELLHVSGETRQFTTPLRLGGLDQKSDAQKMGAAITYARKYSLMALFACMGEKDTDPDAPRRETHVELPAHAKKVVAATTAPAAQTEEKKYTPEELYLLLQEQPYFNAYVECGMKKKKLEKEFILQMLRDHPAGAWTGYNDFVASMDRS